MEHCGIDLHLKSSEVCVLDEAGRVSERSRIPTSEVGLRRWFRGRAGMQICLEAGWVPGTAISPSEHKPGQPFRPGGAWKHPGLRQPWVER